MFRISHNIAATHKSRAAKTPRPDGTGPDELGSDDNPEGGVDRKRELTRLHLAIAALPVLDRQIVLMYFEDLSQDDIAAVTGLSTSAVSTRLHRAKATLTNKLKRSGS